MSSRGRAQDSLWEVLERFGIDPKMKVEGEEQCLLDVLVDFSQPVWFSAGYKQGKHDVAKRLEKWIMETGTFEEDD